MDFALDAEQQAVVETVRAFVERELYPFEEEVERIGDVSRELTDRIRRRALAAGIYAPNMPAELGGGGLDAVQLALAERELGRASYALHWVVGRPSNILLACAGEQRERYLLPAVRGERLDCLAMSEPGAGSDVRSMTTRAVRDHDDYVLNGTKHFISYADKADFVILFAVTGGAPDERRRISGFLIDVGAPGMQVNLDAPTVSHRGYGHCEIVLTDCRVPVDQMLGEEGQGFELIGRWLGSTRLSVAALCVGRARRVFEATADWAATRRQFGQPVGRFQGTGFKLADMAVELDAAELLTLRAAWLHDQGRMTDADAAAAKLYASEMLGRVTDHAVQIFASMGLSTQLPVERWWRDARVERIWDGTSEIQRHVISRALLRARGA